jgi:hypothetical protein
MFCSVVAGKKLDVFFPPEKPWMFAGLGISLVFPPFDVRGGILVSTKAAHVGSTDQNGYCPLFPDFPPGTPQRAAHPVEQCYLCERMRIVGGMSRMLRSASALAASWQCQRCDCIDNSAKNKRRCFLCRAWRDGIAPSSATGITIADAHGGGGTSFCSNENDAPALSI